MIKCNSCKKEKDDLCFIKSNNNYWKQCDSCRFRKKEEKKRYNQKYPDKIIEIKARDYINNKDKYANRNKTWRENNKEKLRDYEKSPKRKEKNSLWRKNKRKQDPCLFMFYAAKRRAKIEGLPFSISKEDIKNIYPIDNKCPMLGIDLFISDKISTDNSPSLDKIIPEKGYIKENILIISYKANRIKNNATIDELGKIFNFLRSFYDKTNHGS